MYNSYNPDLARVRQHELVAEANNNRATKAARQARRERRRVLSRRSIEVSVAPRVEACSPAYPS